MLYLDKRLSKSQALSRASCHSLEKFGVEGEKASHGHHGQRGARNSPSSLNAALELAQFWDGRAADVEAKGPAMSPQTAPYFHDGSLATLDDVVTVMAKHQLGQTLLDADTADLIAFLGALTGMVDAAYIAALTLPESGPKTPAPDPS